MKISIVGTGQVGSSLAYALVLKGLCNHLLLANRNPDKAKGDALDLSHAQTFCERPMRIEGGPLDAVHGSDIVVVTVSSPLRPGMRDRMDLGAANVAIFRELIPKLAANNPDAIFMIVTNPVDVMTYLATQLSKLPTARVIGIGTLVDSARFRSLLSEAERIHPDDLRVYILGEHGPNQFPVFSLAQAGSQQIMDNPANRRLFDEVSNTGHNVMQLKGYTNYAIATAACEVIQTIVYDERRTMPLSTCFDEWLGCRNNCFSIPVVLGRAGVIRHLHPVLNQAEQASLTAAAAMMRQHIDRLLYS
ncbi:MAG: malate dehydrogenase [Gammaproteobacteria bacterium]